jgi:hypothetical protein
MAYNTTRGPGGAGSPQVPLILVQTLACHAWLSAPLLSSPLCMIK